MMPRWFHFKLNDCTEITCYFTKSKPYTYVIYRHQCGGVDGAIYLCGDCYLCSAGARTSASKVQCLYNINLTDNSHSRHIIARKITIELDIMFIVRTQTLICVMLESLQCCINYIAILKRYVTAPNCILTYHSLGQNNAYQRCWLEKWTIVWVKWNFTWRQHTWSYIISIYHSNILVPGEWIHYSVMWSTTFSMLRSSGCYFKIYVR